MPNVFKITAFLVGSSLLATAQNTPHGVEKQAKADRKMDRAHTVRHGESLSKEPKLLKEEDRRDHKKAGKHKFKL